MPLGSVLTARGVTLPSDFYSKPFQSLEIDSLKASWQNAEIPIIRFYIAKLV